MLYRVARGDGLETICLVEGRMYMEGPIVKYEMYNRVYGKQIQRPPLCVSRPYVVAGGWAQRILAPLCRGTHGLPLGVAWSRNSSNCHAYSFHPPSLRTAASSFVFGNGKVGPGRPHPEKSHHIFPYSLLTLVSTPLSLYVPCFPINSKPYTLNNICSPIPY